MSRSPAGAKSESDNKVMSITIGGTIAGAVVGIVVAYLISASQPLTTMIAVNWIVIGAMAMIGGLIAANCAPTPEH